MADQSVNPNFTPAFFTPSSGYGSAPQANPYRKKGKGRTTTNSGGFDAQGNFFQITGVESESKPTPQVESTSTRRFLPDNLSRFERPGQFQSLREPNSQKFFTPVNQGESLGQFGQRVTNRDLQKEFSDESNRRQQSLEPNAFIAGSPTAQAIIDRQEGGIFSKNSIRNTPDFQSLTTGERLSLIGRDLVAGTKRVSDKVGGIITFDKERFDKASDAPLGAFGRFGSGLVEGSVTASFIPTPAISIKPNQVLTQNIDDLRFKSDILDIGKEGGTILQRSRASSIGDGFPSKLNTDIKIKPLDSGGASFEGFGSFKTPGLRATNKGLLNEDFILQTDTFTFKGNIPAGERTVNALSPVRLEGANTLQRGFTELTGGFSPKGTQTLVNRELTSLEGNRIDFTRIGDTSKLNPSIFGERQLTNLQTDFGSVSNFQGAGGKPQAFGQRQPSVQELLRGSSSNKNFLDFKLPSREIIKLENPFEPTTFARGRRIRFVDNVDVDKGFTFIKGSKGNRGLGLQQVQSNDFGFINIKPVPSSSTFASSPQSSILSVGGSSQSIFAGRGQYERTDFVGGLRGGLILEPPRLTGGGLNPLGFDLKTNNKFNNLLFPGDQLKGASKTSNRFRGGTAEILGLRTDFRQDNGQRNIPRQPEPVKQREDLFALPKQTFGDDFLQPPRGFNFDFGGRRGRGFNFPLGFPGGELINFNPPRRTGRRKLRYNPSLIAVELGITSRSIPNTATSGLTIRPIILKGRKRRRNDQTLFL